MDYSTTGKASDEWEAQDSSAHENKFLVTIRLRPLNDKEFAKNDVADWECIDNTTIMFKTAGASMLPAVYTFDRVFGPEIPTRQVYEEAAQKIAVLVLSGINSSIFAYGQTSSGKTYTMSGVTEYAIADIFDCIDRHPEREYMLKFSALEIYNEIVKDLLSTDGTPRRLLDDPVRGTVVERLTEVEIRDASHLRELLSICQAHRKVGETALSEVSSRSHQILCLTVESFPRRGLSTEDAITLTASVNFVDLAGSERSTQTGAVGTRLKEGSHINRSLLTLGTVIRKLSQGMNGHVPFRDSKLTRILHNSLGGNARTAIICTMSPARSHVEQSKSTLGFANCARKISSNAQVNTITPQKVLVKQLRKEITRLENEVKTLTALVASDDSVSTLQGNELIDKLKKEIKELNHQHDLVKPHDEDILHSEASTSVADFHNQEKVSWMDESSASKASERFNPLLSDVSSRTCNISDKREAPRFRQFPSFRQFEYQLNSDEQFLSNDTSPRSYIDKYFGSKSPPDPGWIIFSGNMFEGYLDVNTGGGTPNEDRDSGGSSLCPSDEDAPIDASGNESCTELTNEKEESSQNKKQNQGSTSDIEPEDYSYSFMETDNKNEEGENIETFSKAREMEQQDYRMEVEPKVNRNTLQTKDAHISFKTEKEEAMERFDPSGEAKAQEHYARELKKVMMRNLSKHFEDDMVRRDPSLNGAIPSGKEANSGSASTPNWYTQQQEIIKLWAACNVPLVYRTYFFLLFKGDPSDTVYLEVELRRLSFLKNKLQGDSAVKDDQFLTEATSVKALNREIEMLSRHMHKKFSRKERKALYQKWGINQKTKQRRLQLCHKLWTDTADMEHVRESAAIVAKLVGFKEPGNEMMKEMIGFSFLPKTDSHRVSSWKRRRHSLTSLI